MSSRFLELSDGVVVEIDGPEERKREMHTSTADLVATSMQSVAGELGRILDPIKEAFAGLYQTLNTPIVVDKAEVELGLSFSAEGKLFLVAGGKAEGSLKVKVCFKAIESTSAPRGIAES